MEYGTSPLQVSPNGSLFHLYFPPWGAGGAEFAAFVIKFYLPESAPGIKDAKMGGTADFGYDIIYGSYIVGGALSCSVQVTGVQVEANCSIWFSCNHSRVDPWRVFIVHLFKDNLLP